MAEGWLKYYGKKYLEVYSAGLKATEVSPFAKKAMSEAVVEIPQNTSKTIADLEQKSFDFVICFDREAFEQCPELEGNPEKELFETPDPSKEEGDDMTRLRVYRAVCNSVEDKCLEFVQKHFNFPF